MSVGFVRCAKEGIIKVDVCPFFVPYRHYMELIAQLNLGKPSIDMSSPWIRFKNIKLNINLMIFKKWDKTKYSNRKLILLYSF